MMATDKYGTRLSRRTILGGAAATAMTAILAACGGGSGGATDTPKPASGTTGSAAAGAPATGGTAKPAVQGTPVVVEGKADGSPVTGGSLIIAYADVPTLDPRVSGATDWWRASYALFDPLIYQEPGTLKLIPGLAQSWQAADDGKSYTLKLRQDVKFHDGTPFNADAVKYTFDSIMDPALKSLTAIGYLGPYAGTDVIDPYTVKVNFKDPYAPFLNNLTHSVLAPVSPVAGKNYDAFAAHPVGTGPFMFKEYKAQVSMTFVRNPDYKWGPTLMRNQGAPYLDQVTYRFIPAGELTTQLGLLQNGEVQMSNGVAPQELTNLQKDAKFQTLLPLVPGSPQIFPLNLLKTPTDDLKVRQAMFYALDMPAIVDTLWFGGRKAARGPLSSPTLDYNPAVESMYGYDPKKAGSLLDEAGWKMGSDGIRAKDGQRLKVLTIITTGIEGKNAELAQAYFKAVGIDNQVDEQEYAQTATRYLAGEHNIARIYFSHTDPVVLTTLYHSKNIQGTNFNRTMKPDPKLDAMLDAAQADVNAETRKQKYFDIQQYIMDNALAIPRWEERVFWVAKANIKGLHFQPLGGPWLQDVWIAAQ
jgi:peptide/nickel transport system substrate-binding protein